MAKLTKAKKAGPARTASPQKSYSPEAQEMRALLRRVPDGLKATLSALAAKSDADRERVMAELARGMGKEVLPLFKAAAASSKDDLSATAIRVMPVFATRAAADILAEIYLAEPESDRARLAAQGARALQARGIRVSIPLQESPPETTRYVLRETAVSVPDGVGSRSVAARLQDQYGVWHAVFVLWNDQVGIRDAFMRQMSRAEWVERMERADERGFAWVPCPADYARWQVKQGRKLGPEGAEAALSEWDELIGAPPDGYEPPLPASPDAARDLEEGALLFQVPDVQRWFLEAADCAEYARKLGDLRVRSRLRESETDLKAEFEALEKEATSKLIHKELRKLYTGRLEDLARASAWRGQDDSARRAAAAATAARKAPENVPFFRRLVDRSLRAAEALILRGEDLEKLRYRPGKRLARRG